MDMKGKFRVALITTVIITAGLIVFSGRVASGDETALVGFIVMFLGFGICAPVTIYYNQRRQGSHASFREAQFMENITRSLEKEGHHDKAKNPKT